MKAHLEEESDGLVHERWGVRATWFVYPCMTVATVTVAVAGGGGRRVGAVGVSIAIGYHTGVGCAVGAAGFFGAMSKFRHRQKCQGVRGVSRERGREGRGRKKGSQPNARHPKPCHVITTVQSNVEVLKCCIAIATWYTGSKERDMRLLVRGKSPFRIEWVIYNWRKGVKEERHILHASFVSFVIIMAENIHRTWCHNRIVSKTR